MVKNSFIPKVLLVALILCSVIMAHGRAAVNADPIGQPVTVASLCSDQAFGTAQWRIGNANPGTVVVSWNGGQMSVPYGYTTVTTAYTSNNPSPSVVFQQAGLPDQTVPVSSDACTQPIEGCVDGYTRANLHLDWSPSGKVIITTVNGAPLCADVTVFLSTYTLPKSYDGSGIFDDSSLPQQKFSSTSALLLKGTTGGVTLATAVPDSCTDYQLDAYYDPEVSSVSYSGHGSQLIYGKIYVHTATDCTVAVTPTLGGRGGGQVAGASTTTPVASTPPSSVTPQALADTGQSTILPAVGAAVMALSAVAIKFPVLAKFKNLFATQR